MATKTGSSKQKNDASAQAKQVALSTDQLTKTAHNLSEMTKKDLASVAEALAKSGLDGEKLQRLMKLACKANTIQQATLFPGCMDGYHY